MSFKFTFLGLEMSDRRSNYKADSETELKMVKSKNGLTPQQKKFKTAQSKCHAETDSPKSFGKCMSEKLSKKKSKSNSKKK
jgi:hypothetical protein